MRKQKIILIIFAIISLACKSDSNKFQIIKTFQDSHLDFLKKIIDREEFDTYTVDNYLIGEFYSPKTDSLIIFKLSPKSDDINEVVSNINEDKCDIICKKNILKKHVNSFSIEEYLVLYEYVIEQKDAGGYDVFNVKKPFKVDKKTYSAINNNESIIVDFKSFNELYLSLKTSGYNIWEGNYSFSLEDLTRMGETHNVGYEFDITNLTSPEVIMSLDNESKKIKKCEITYATKDTLVLMDMNKSDDIYILSKDEKGNYNIAGSPIYLLNPPNESYPLSKN